MNRNITRMLIACAGICMLVLLTGCGDSTPAAPENTPLPSAATTTPLPEPTDTPSEEPSADTEASREALLLAVTGAVEIRREGEILPAGEGTPLQPGDMLVTGEDGGAVIEMDDGTIVEISEQTELTLQEIDGTVEDPVTRFFLRLGAIFAFHENLPALSDDAAFEVETPTGVAAIRGSSMGVTYDDITLLVICLSGACTAQAGSTDPLDLAGWERTAVQEGMAGPVEPLTDEDIALAEAVFAAVQSAGIFEGENFATVFDQPPAIPTPTPVYIPPTSTPVPPTSTPVPPTAVPPTQEPPPDCISNPDDPRC